MRTLEQKRAEFAYGKVKSVKGKNFEGDYARYVKNAPALILTNGLGNTLAFYRSKMKKGERDAYAELYSHIEEWLKKQEYCDENQDLLEWISNTDSLLVFQATQEVLALLNWMTKFAKAELEEGEES